MAVSPDAAGSSRRQEVDGYVANVTFEPSYRPEQSPPLLRLIAGGAIPAGRKLRYLDLGFGMGTTLNVHAAACPGEYWGCDINPLHVAAAEELARCAGTGVRALQTSFAALLERGDLPTFDIVVAHGVWSWVSEANRAVIVRLLQRHLAPGGLFCMNSLALPRAAQNLPFQRLMRLHKRRGETSNSGDLPGSGLAFASLLQRMGAVYFAPDSENGRLLESVQRSDPAYIEHEYLNENWHPALFADTAAALGRAGLRFAASADPLGNYEELRYTARQRTVLDAIDDPALRETSKDFLRPKWKRFDVFVKGEGDARPRRPRIAREMPFVLAVPAAVALTDEHPAADGAVRFDTSPLREIVVTLAAQGHRPRRFGELVEAAGPGCGEDAVARALMLLIDHDAVHPVHDPAPARETVEACARLNGEIARRARTGDEIAVLASPVAGHGVPLSRAQRLCLLAIGEGARSVEAWARFVQTTLQADGVAVAASEVLKQVLLFEASLPALATLGLVDRALIASGG